MAEPTRNSTDLTQPKSPYFKFDKALFDALLRSLSGVELKVALAVERHTKGHYAQEDAEIAVSLLVDWTGCSRNAILQARRRLIVEGVLEEVSSHSNRRGARLRVTRDPALWGAIPVPQEVHLQVAGGQGNAPVRSSECTSGGRETAPLEVSENDPLNGLNRYEDPSERGQLASDDTHGSPTSGLAAFREGLRDAPDWARAGLHDLHRIDEINPTPAKELP